MPKTKKKTTAPKMTKAPQSKTAFVMSLPAKMPAKDVIARAKAQGMTISTAYVYGIRTRLMKGKAGGARGGAKLSGNGASRVEELLLAAAAEIGLPRAIDLLQSQQRRVRAVLHG